MLGIEEARAKARETIAAIKAGADRAGPQSFQAVAEDWFKRHVVAKGLITAKQTRRYLDKHILPEWGGREFTSIKRGDVAKLLDKIEDNAGPAAADQALSLIGNICNWFAAGTTTTPRRSCGGHEADELKGTGSISHPHRRRDQGRMAGRGRHLWGYGPDPALDRTTPRQGFCDALA